MKAISDFLMGLLSEVTWVVVEFELSRTWTAMGALPGLPNHGHGGQEEVQTSGPGRSDAAPAALGIGGNLRLELKEAVT